MFSGLFNVFGGSMVFMLVDLMCVISAIPLLYRIYLTRIMVVSKVVLGLVWEGLPKVKMYGSKEIFLSLFLILSVLNLVGVWSFIWPITSYFSITLSLGFTMWLAVILYQFCYFFNKSISHFLPMSTPFFLVLLMVPTEMISSMARPFTLSFRLAVNITTGHLILGLVGSFPWYLLWCSWFIVGLEVLVSIVQAYVFVLLLMLYLQEV